jgi:hypothetical protein
MARVWDHYEFKISGHYLPALINGDYSGLEDEEIRELHDWMHGARVCAMDSGFTVGHWSHDECGDDDWGRCEVSGLFAMRETVRLMVYKGE